MAVIGGHRDCRAIAMDSNSRKHHRQPSKRRTVSYLEDYWQIGKQLLLTIFIRFKLL